MQNAKKPNWIYWNNLAEVLLMQAVELSCDIAPGEVQTIDSSRYIRSDLVEVTAQIRERLSLARSHINAGKLRVRFQAAEQIFGSASPDGWDYITLSEFRKWGEGLPSALTFPAEFPQQDTNPPCGGKSTAQDAPVFCWPWGKHDTKALGLLVSAGNKFWTNYDPSDQGTAPTNAAVVKWLKEKGATTRLANNIAAILRADGLRPGRRN